MKRYLIVFFITMNLVFPAKTEKAPEWVLQNTVGENIALYDLKGKVIVIDFWAVWCATCKPELRELSELQDELKDQGVSVLGIGVDSGDPEFLKEFKIFLGLNFPLLSGRRRTVKRILRDYGNIRRIPTIVIINRQGNIAYRITGFRPKNELIELIRPLL